ncbi:MAG: AmmeMemoRadiSam system protein A [Candidatus Marinimicrobia bacterium]|nr:AmmeMemoRadiSam system protein A [Candidatus Neomarinimicrobiota bacterium]MBT3576914.1 AmmeMemoRadiSam system protein A [Candidatus Neomarinimicrobiota bacterium]MBT3681367.1 AmmeMemoRadiSam system protein A [Candidatus Neomarinimicrobiota bacterium]MBT3951955.1 AmmeMemoRadiSam system protein A [Candidatus Neomarinimicrobiota bacterium]MBT4251836.1 AmmeMemoRadiSam system protein A [Candidatus Neomarinimicrobiota bacterium]
MNLKHTSLSPQFSLSRSAQLSLLSLARESIQHGLDHGSPVRVNPGIFDAEFNAPGAAFVTLEKQGDLRGCIGSVEAYRPLVEDVAENAWNAAFTDPRFSPVTSTEFHQLHIEISVLTQPEEMAVESEDDLKNQLVPFKDGLIIRDGYHRGLFLPAVWDKLPDVDSFLSHLKQKAGFPQGYWSDSISCQKFYSVEFGDEDA